MPTSSSTKAHLESGCSYCSTKCYISSSQAPLQPTCHKDLAGKIPIILDGVHRVGLESTVLDMTSESPVILRPVGLHMNSSALYLKSRNRQRTLIRRICTKSGHEIYALFPKSGSNIGNRLYRKNKRNCKENSGKETNLGRRVGIMATSETMNAYSIGDILDIGSRRPSTIAANLFSALREFDNRGVDLIIAEGLKKRYRISCYEQNKESIGLQYNIC